MAGVKNVGGCGCCAGAGPTCDSPDPGGTVNFYYRYSGGAAPWLGPVALTYKPGLDAWTGYRTELFPLVYGSCTVESSVSEQTIINHVALKVKSAAAQTYWIQTATLYCTCGVLVHAPLNTDTPADPWIATAEGEPLAISPDECPPPPPPPETADPGIIFGHGYWEAGCSPTHPTKIYHQDSIPSPVFGNGFWTGYRSYSENA